MGFLLNTTRHCLRTRRSLFQPKINHVARCCFSTTTSPLLLARFGLGGNNWSRMDPMQYQSVVQTSLEQGITVMEAGQEGGDKALLEALQTSSSSSTPPKEPLTITFRIGYHTILPAAAAASGGDAAAAAAVQEKFPGDVAVEQHPFLGPNRTMTPMDEPTDMSPFNQPDAEDETQMIQILHNMTGNFIDKELQDSPLVQEYKKQDNNSTNMNVVALLHNPEAQIMALAQQEDVNQVSIEERQAFLRDKLVAAFAALEKAVANKTISSYGVVSNGLCLPLEHPLALSPTTILQASQVVLEQCKTCNLSVIQLPINLMERTGLEIAQDLAHKIDTEEQYQHLSGLEIYAMRPLTCYPDRGTGTGHPFRLVDYLLPSGPKPVLEEDETTDDKQIPDEELASKQWSNQMQGPPLIYSIALKKAMSHFDAEFLLEEKIKRDLTAEERETLDGCKLLQSMLHDLDAGLANVRSLGAHEQDLYKRIIPLIHDTFEEYDEDTADVLEMFFKSYSLAVRYSIANNTRILLQQGGDDGNGFQYKDIPEDEKLQDYALKYLLKETAIDRVIVGATQPDQVVQMAKLSQSVAASEQVQDATE